jgi:hypothetical protein
MFNLHIALATALGEHVCSLLCYTVVLDMQKDCVGLYLNYFIVLLFRVIVKGSCNERTIKSVYEKNTKTSYKKYYEKLNGRDIKGEKFL